MNASISMTLTGVRQPLDRRVHGGIGRAGPDRARRRRRLAVALPPASFRERALAHLERVRRWARRDGSFRVATRNSFPTGAGIASSASGFAALTLASTKALGLTLSIPGAVGSRPHERLGLGRALRARRLRRVVAARGRRRARGRDRTGLPLGSARRDRPRRSRREGRVLARRAPRRGVEPALRDPPADPSRAPGRSSGARSASATSTRSVRSSRRRRSSFT